jgi:hypothetical protein
MSVGPLLVDSLLLAVPASPAMYMEVEELETLVVQMASKPEHHAAIADYYRGKAETARKQAQRHRSMASAYREADVGDREAIRAYCTGLATGYELLAREYDQLADLHDPVVRENR